MSRQVENGDGNDELWPTKYMDDVAKAAKVASAHTALIILNSPIPRIDVLRQLYDHASFRVCADGGANRLMDLLRLHQEDGGSDTAVQKFLPTLIHGDLDSLRHDVQHLYERLGVKISKDPDQYSTDFGKAVKKVIEQVPDVQDILVLGSIGGRVDQGIGLLGEFYREQKLRHPRVRFWLFSESSVSTILRARHTTIHTPVKAGQITRNVGILPLYGRALITTQGLEWDVEEWPTEMGGQMSTSNHIVADKVTVSTNNEVLFTVERAEIG